MCGILGIVGKNPVNQLLYDGLLVLQHRGQDAAGIVTCDGNTFFMHKNNGLVKDVFHTRHMRNLIGNAGISHVRYPTAGSSSAAEAQPFYVNSPFGIVLGHNGNLTNAEKLKEDIFRQDRRHINTTSDSEVLQLRTWRDLLEYYPFRYIDRSKITTIREIRDDSTAVQLLGEIVSMKEVGALRSKRLTAPLS